MSDFSKTIHRDRLDRLAGHLEAGFRDPRVLGHDFFDFSRITVGSRKPNGCGTAGCALGELPVVFPEAWTFEYIPGAIWLVVSFAGRHEEWVHDVFADAAHFFGITVGQSKQLFLPHRVGDPLPAWNIKTGILRFDATAGQVAQGIRNFLAWVGPGQLEIPAPEAIPIAVPEPELELVGA